MTYAKNTKQAKTRTPQPVTQKVYDNQIKNTQGFYVNPLQGFEQLARFLVLGTDKPTYHAGTKNVDKNVTYVEQIVKDRGIDVVNFLLDFDNRNIAPKREPMIFVLAYCLKCGDIETRRAASEAAKTIIRTGRDIEQFVSELVELGGWGKLTKSTVAEWYLRSNTAYQVTKYRNTGSQYNHRNILRLSHPKAETQEQNHLFRYLVGKDYDVELLPKQVLTFEKAINAQTEKEVLEAIKAGVTHEMIPTQFKKSAKVWDALVDNMPYRALVWNLGTFSELGLLTPMSNFEAKVLNKLKNEAAIIGSRIHPFTMLVAIRNYAKGKGERKEWTVNQRIVAALENAMDVLYKNVEKTDAKLALIVDVSGSMSSSWADYNRSGNKNLLSGSNIRPIEGAGAMAAIQSRSSNAYVLGVDQYIHELRINENSTISSVTKELGSFRGGATNLGLGIQHLTKNNINVDAIVFYTDNEVNQGLQVQQLFDVYKRTINANAKLIVVAFEANDFSIGDSSRKDVINICGFDSGTISVINAFAEGKVS